MSAGSTPPSEHSGCRDVLISAAKLDGVDVDVSAVESQHPMAASFVCPHGVRYWTLPTSEQFGRWAEDGTP